MTVKPSLARGASMSRNKTGFEMSSHVFRLTWRNSSQAAQNVLGSSFFFIEKTLIVRKSITP